MPEFYKIIKKDKEGEVVGVVPKVGYENIPEALWHNFGVRSNGRVFKAKRTTIRRRCTFYLIDPLDKKELGRLRQQKHRAKKTKEVKTMPEKTDFSKMTHADFIRLLSAEMDKEGKPSALLTIPQIYEIVSEHYNNAVLEAWENEQNEKKNL